MQKLHKHVNKTTCELRAPRSLMRTVHVPTAPWPATERCVQNYFSNRVHLTNEVPATKTGLKKDTSLSIIYQDNWACQRLAIATDPN